MASIKLKSKDFEKTDQFDAVIESVEVRDGLYGQQVVINVRPTSFVYDKETMPLFYKYSESDKGNWFKFVRACEDLQLKLDELDDLKGLHLRWRRHEDIYQIDGEEKVSRYSLPIKKLQPLTEQTSLPTEGTPTPQPSSPPTQAPVTEKPATKATKSVSSDDIKNAIMEFIADGEPHQVKDLYDALGKKGFAKSKVLQAVKGLDAEGKLVLADNNVVKNE